MLDEKIVKTVMDEVWTPEVLAQRLDELIEQRLTEAARDCTSLAVLEWKWPPRN